MTARLASPLRRWGGALVDFLYPPVCPLCFERLPSGLAAGTVCWRCQALMRVSAHERCARCGSPLGEERSAAAAGPCPLCPPSGSHYRGVLSVTGYWDPAPRCVHLFKYHRRWEMGRWMSRMMLEELEAPFGVLSGRLDCVAPVPLHWARRLMRGFNQSHWLAQPLAARLQLPYDEKLLRRRRWTARQALLPREARRDNVAGAFGLRPGRALQGKGILLVDDVVTTGETVGECARVLREAGAREVWVACFARPGVPGRPNSED